WPGPQRAMLAAHRFRTAPCVAVFRTSDSRKGRPNLPQNHALANDSVRQPPAKDEGFGSGGRVREILICHWYTSRFKAARSFAYLVFYRLSECKIRPSRTVRWARNTPDWRKSAPRLGTASEKSRTTRATSSRVITL